MKQFYNKRMPEANTEGVQVTAWLNGKGDPLRIVQNYWIILQNTKFFVLQVF